MASIQLKKMSLLWEKFTDRYLPIQKYLPMQDISDIINDLKKIYFYGAISVCHIVSCGYCIMMKNKTTGNVRIIPMVDLHDMILSVKNIFPKYPPYLVEDLYFAGIEDMHKELEAVESIKIEDKNISMVHEFLDDLFEILHELKFVNDKKTMMKDIGNALVLIQNLDRKKKSNLCII